MNDPKLNERPDGGPIYTATELAGMDEIPATMDPDALARRADELSRPQIVAQLLRYNPFGGYTIKQPKALLARTLVNYWRTGRA